MGGQCSKEQEAPPTVDHKVRNIVLIRLASIDGSHRRKYLLFR